MDELAALETSRKRYAFGAPEHNNAHKPLATPSLALLPIDEMFFEDHTNTEGLSEYELQRLERIKKNQAYLAKLGLADHNAPWKKQLKKKKKTSPQKRPLVDTELRISKRIRLRSRKADNDEEPLVMLSYKEPDTESPRTVTQAFERRRTASDEDDDNDDEGATGRKRSSYRPSRRRFRGTNASSSLSETEKKLLEKNEMDTNYLTKFREFLVYHNKISPQNERNVMRQVTKLAKGQGVRYESPQYGWPEDCVFCKGKKITPLSDLIELLDEAIEAEDRWGRDHGNGWLLRHPIKKLLMFQQFCLQHPDFLTAECRLKDYYDGQYDDGDESDDVEEEEKEEETESVRGEVGETKDSKGAEVSQDKEQEHTQEWPNGTRIRKQFGGAKQWYIGTVKSFDAQTGWYWISYEDGDEEELDAREVRKVVVP